MKLDNIKILRIFTFLLILACFLIPYRLLFINFKPFPDSHDNFQDWVLNWVWGLSIFQIHEDEPVKYWSFSLDFSVIFGFGILIICVLALISTIFYKKRNYFEIIISRLINYGAILFLISLFFLFFGLISSFDMLNLYSYVVSWGFIPTLPIILVIMCLLYIIIAFSNSRRFNRKEIDLEKEKKEHSEKRRVKQLLIIIIFCIFVLFFYMGLMPIISTIL